MEQDSRYNGIVDPKGEVMGRHGRHGHHCLWNEPCEDPRVLMYIDDENCQQNGAVMADRGREEPVADHHAVEDGPPPEAQSTPQPQSRPQASAEAAATTQSQQQGNADAAAYYQYWQQRNTESAANTQGWAQANAAGGVRPQTCTGIQFHVHEVQGTVEIAGREPHTHRFTAVSGEARPWGSANHYHDVRFRTDYFDDHFHEGWGRTGGAIQVGDKHVHFLEAATTQNDGHMHRYKVATMIEDPIGG